MSYFKYFESREKGTAIVSLGPGDLLLESLREAARKADIHTGVVMTGIGSLTKADFNVGAGRIRLEKPLEVVNFCGVIAEYEPHIHITMLDSMGTFFGGHLNEGCTVNTVAEISIQRIPDVRLARKTRDGSKINLLDFE